VVLIFQNPDQEPDQVSYCKYVYCDSALCGIAGSSDSALFLIFFLDLDFSFQEADLVLTICIGHSGFAGPPSSPF
jgi:hypothetical protein